MKISHTPINPTQAFLTLIQSLALCWCLVSSLSAQTIDQGLILQMGFSENLDEKAGNAVVTEYGNLSYAEDRTGGNRCALWLSGMFTDYLSVASTSDNALTGSDPFSISVWFKTLSTNSNFQKIITKGPNTTGGFELGLFDGNTPLAGDRTFNYGLWDNEWNMDPNLGNDQEWHHLVFVRDAQNKIYLYRDGELRNSDDTYDFRIGDDPLDYYIGRDFQGFLDDLRVYDRALNPNDVVTLFQLEADCELIISPTCLDVQYDNSPFPFTGTNYQAGSSVDPLFVLTDDIKLTLENWVDQNNTDHFGSLILYGYLGVDNDLFVFDSIGMSVDFSGLADPVTEVNFTLLPACCGKDVNFSINNGPTYYYENVNDIPSVLPDGTEVEVTIDSSFPLDWKYYFTLSGPVFEKVTIGGTNGLALKDFCFDSEVTEFECFGFTDFPDGTFYGEGGGQNPGFQMANSDPDLKVTLEEYVSGPNTSFGRIENPTNGPYLNSLSMNLKVDFTNVPETVTEFRFLTENNGPGYNFAANGGAILEVFDLNTMPLTLPGGAIVNKTEIPGSTNLYAITISSPNLTSITFGGLDMQFYEMCYSSIVQNNCSIGDLSAIHYCSDFYLEVDFEHQNTTNDSFDLYLNGSLYGSYLFADLPLGLDQLPSSSAFYTAKVCVKDDPSCCSEIVDVQQSGCTTIIGNPTVVQFCNNSILQVDFDYNNPGSDSFELYLDGAPFGTYLFSSLPLAITLPPGSPIYQDAKVCNPIACSEWVAVIHENCDPCDLNEIQVDYEILPCTANGVFSIQVALLDITNNSDSFGIVGNGQNYGHFSYFDPLPEIGTFAGDGNTVYELGFFDLNNPDCKEFVAIGPITCPINDCEINDLLVEVWDCDQNGDFLVDVNFNYVGTSDSFYIVGNGLNHGTYAYSDLWLSIGPFPGDGTTEYEFIIIDQNDQACKAAFELGTVSCSAACNIYDLLGEVSDCDAAGQFTVDIDFGIQNPGPNGFMVIGNGTFYGTFDYAALPITLGPFPGNSGNDLQFNVFDANDPFCIGVVDIEAVNCNTVCELTNLLIEDLGCVNGINKYKIDFDPNNATSDGFMVTLLGNTFGPYNYADLPIYIEYNAAVNQAADLQICDFTNPNCCISALVEVRNCTPDCPILNVEVEAVECFDGEFYTLIYVEHDPNSNSPEFTVVINNKLYGPYPYTQSPVLIGPFPSSSTPGLLGVEVHDPMIDCSVYSEVVIPDCPLVACSITDLEVTALECTGPNTLSIKINFEHENANGDLFTVYTSNNTLFNTYSLNDLPLTITNFPDTDFNGDYLRVCIKDSPNCCAEADFQSLNCSADCSITNVISTPGDCNAAGQFYVTLNFTYENNLSDFFTVVGNGTNYGEFLYSDLPIQLGPFDGNGNTVLEFLVTDLEDDNCIGESLLDAPLCGQNCSITDLNVNWEGCNLDGTSNLYLNFNSQNTNNDLFDVFFQGENIGTYELDQLPITIHNFPGVTHNQGFDVLVVCINDNPNCCAEADFDIVPCPMDYTCIDFEELSTNMVFNGNEIIPGNFVFESAGIDVSFGDCYEVTNSSIFEIRDQYDNGTNCGNVTNSGQTLFLQNAGIFLDFTSFSPIPSSVSFDFCNEGYLSIAGIADSIFFDATDNTITLGTGHEILIEPYGPNSIAGTVTISGGIEGLTICGMESTFDNICINSTPPTPNNDCVAFEELEDGFSYDLNNHDALLLESNGVEVTMLNGLSYAQATSTPQWTMFNAASGLHIFLGGELEFDFSGIGDPVEFVSFDFSGGVDNELTVNGGTTFSFDFDTPDTVLFVAPGITMFFNRDATNTSEGNISLFGEVENMVIGGIELAIDNVCYYTSIQVAQVWPGDANSDNIANHCDLLNLGVAFGQQGFARPNQNTDWNGLNAEDWPEFFADGTTNFKHSDCNGDGIIDLKDLEIIQENYGLEHGPVEPVVSLASTPNDPPIYVDLASLGTLSPGQTVSAPLVLGSFDVPVEGIYGIAFTLEYDPQMIIPSSIEFESIESWLGTPNADLLSIDRSDMADGRIEIAISRIDQINKGGFGEIGNFIGVIDDIVGKEAPTNIKVTNIKAINAMEVALALHTPTFPGLISTDIEDNKDINGLLVFPVPTTDILNIHNYNPVDMRMLTVYNVLGQKLHEERFPKQKTTVDVSAWPSGIYYIDIKLPESVITKKFKVTRM